MTLHRLIDDLQDALRQAMADGPHGTGRRGLWLVMRWPAWVHVGLIAQRGAEGFEITNWAIAPDRILPSGELPEEWVELLVRDAIRQAHDLGTDLELPSLHDERHDTSDLIDLLRGFGAEVECA